MMNRLLWIITNDRDLSGVKRDVRNITNYFRSITGGLWYDHEIHHSPNPSINVFEAEMAAFRRNKYDYVVIYFSGHGGYNQGTTLELNSNGEEIHESVFFHLASRQLMIFDSCRVTDETYLADMFTEQKQIDSYDQFQIRKKFDDRIMKSEARQLIRLYSCSYDEYSNDTFSGGIYTNQLLNTIAQAKPGDIDPIEVQAEVRKRVSKIQPDQNPDATYTKLPKEKRIVIGIKPHPTPWY